MKAVYTNYPYKFWTLEVLGEMFLFSDNDEAERFATKNSYFLCNDPNEHELAHTWSMLAWAYLCCGGTIRIERPDGWDAVFVSERDKEELTYEEFEDRLFDTYDMPCIECWLYDYTDGKSVNTGLTYEETYRK